MSRVRASRVRFSTHQRGGRSLEGVWTAMKKHHDLVDFLGQYVGETPKAVRVIIDEKDVWLPKSQVEYERRSGNSVEVTMPEWLAEKKGLL